jgi:hypothetical protein
MVLPVPADSRRRVSAETAREIAHNAFPRKPPSLMRQAEIMTLSISALSAA